MKVDVMPDGTIRVKQLYNSIVLETDDSQQAVFIVQGNPGELAYITPKATGADIIVKKFG